MSTMLGSASVVVSPKLFNSFSAIFLKILRMIFPDLVFGKSYQNCMESGFAIGPISLTIRFTNSPVIVSDGFASFMRFT